ncbi:MAG: alpha/beta fold hydrolase [Raineya sp.]
MDGVYLQTQKMQCLQIGEGEKILFAFHGFGQNPNVFECLRPLLPNYTIYSFDLLSFGKEPQKKEIFRLVDEFCHNQQIKKFSIVSFSIGSKIALSLLENFSEKIEKMILIAPDGFRKSYWYQFATSFFGKKLFWQFIKNPHYFLKIAHYLSKIKILNKELLKITQIYTDTPPKRFLLWRTWLSQKHLFPNHKVLHKVYQENQIFTKIFATAEDRFCPLPPILTFSKNHTCIEVVQSPTKHHRLLNETLKNSYFLDFLK